MGHFQEKILRKKRCKEMSTSRLLGAVGVGRGVGVTHLCLLMANYLCSGCGKRTAVLEWNEHGDFARFGNVCTGSGQTESRYQIQDVDFYPESCSSKLAECLGRGYQEILIDFGSLSEEIYPELMYCQKIFCVVSFSEWQEGVFGKKRIWAEYAGKNGWLCLTAFGSEESRIRWNKRRHPFIQRIPFSADAFTVTEQVINWMRQIV